MRSPKMSATWGLCCLVGFSLTVFGQERYVSPAGNDGNDGSAGAPWATVAHGVAQMSGGTLWLFQGTHTLSGEVVVNPSLVVRSLSGDAQDTVVAGDGTFRCFRLSGAQAALRGLTITNGNALLENGGGVLLSGAQAALHDCTIAGSAARHGAGVYVQAGATEGLVSNCVVRGNRTLSGSGGGVYLGNGLLVDSRIEANVAREGAGVRAEGGRIAGCTILANRNAGGVADEIYQIDVDGQDYVVHKYTSAGSAIFTAPAGVTNVEYLVVAGGGGGGLKSSTAGGGGGAGGMLTGSVAVAAAAVYDVAVGAGGSGSVNGVLSFGGDGEPSRFDTIEATGGGGGQGAADTEGTSGRDGGSGGGGSRFNNHPYPGGSGIPGQGHDGGSGTGFVTISPSVRSYAGGGGGGAGSPGHSTTGYPDSPPGHGGTGVYSRISGVETAYAGGGGGGGTSVTRGLGGLGGGGDGSVGTTDGQAGEPNTGGGGGGSLRGGENNSGSGGSGIVIVRHLLPEGMTLDELIAELNAQTVPGGAGGGVYAANGTELENCRIDGNYGSDQGAGVYLAASSPELPCRVAACTIVSNRASLAGGGLHLHADAGADCLVTGSVIRWNRTFGQSLDDTSGGSGGGAYLAAGSIEESLIADNASGKGGGVYSDGGRLSHCTFRDNLNARAMGDEVYLLSVGEQEYVVHKYTRAGSAVFIPPAGVGEVEYLVVAGGGGGGLKSSTGGGGGGAGGMLTGTVAVAGHATYEVHVGAGGTGSVNAVQCFGGDGEASLFHTLEAVGGGGGQGLADTEGNSGRDGGSGGGGARWNITLTFPGGSGIPGQGHDGGAGKGQIKVDGVTVYGRAGGGGGGAGGTGASTDGSATVRGNGGPGRYCSITGAETAYAGGGGGGGTSTTLGYGGVGGGGDGANGSGEDGDAGEPNTGGGGGGSRSGGIGNSGAGGSGIVVIRYALPEGMTEEELVEEIAAGATGGKGGGVYAAAGTLLRNCLIAGNSGSEQGGGVYVGDSSALPSNVIESCTIAGNLAYDAGAGLYLVGLGPDEVWNTIVYHNAGADVWLGGSAADRIGYSCLPETLAGAGNLTDDPQFIAPEQGDYRLKRTSPCVDAGTNRAWMAVGARDLDGAWRLDLQSRQVDIGCYEYAVRATILLIR